MCCLRGRTSYEQFLDYPYQLIGRLGLRYEGVGSSFECGALHLGRIVRGKDNDLCRGRSFSDFRSRLQAVHHGHADVEDNQIRLKFENQVQRFLAVFGFATNVPSGLAIEERPKSLAHHFMVVGENYPQMGTPWLEATVSICHEVASLPYCNSCISDWMKEFVKL
jgi:hypothetical protein